MIPLFKQVFWRHRWEHPENGNPYRRTCTVCGEQQEWDNDLPYETGQGAYHWSVWNKGDHEKHWRADAR